MDATIISSGFILSILVYINLILSAVCFSTAVSTTAMPALMFPFGASVGDTFIPANDDGSSTEIFISSLFPFFGDNQDSLYVNTNGVISFSLPFTSYTPDAFPLNDSRLIAPYWGDVDTTNGGSNSYREIIRSSETESLFLEADAIVSVVEDVFFRATWMFVATWDQVGYYGSLSPDIVNTFQAVLVTNGTHSFTIFNYETIQWTCTASNVSAQVGVNAGDGVRSYSFRGSQTADIVNIDTTSNVATPGRWVFRVDEAQIEDHIDKCTTKTDDCHANATCINTVGNYTCQCNDGYDGNGRTCSDIDECATNTDDCNANATCINTVGNYTCQCNDGFDGNGRTCSDIDECAKRDDDCHADATCINIVASYTCHCNGGYDGNGRTCSDIDECETNVDACHADATCTNTVGNYMCECKADYERMGSTCAVNEDLDSIAKIPVTENNVVDVVANLTQVINEGITINSKGLENIAFILDGIADLELPAEHLTRSVVAIVDDVLTNYDDNRNEDASTPQDDDVSPIEVSPIPNQIQRALESQISSLQSDPDGSNNTVIEGENVVIHAVKIPRESLINNNLVFESIPSGDMNSANGRSTRVKTGHAPDRKAEAASSLPSDVFLSATGNSSAAVPVSFFVYQNTKLFPSQRLINDSNNPNQIRVAVASRIITANVEGAEEIIDLPVNSQVETIFALVLEKEQNARIGNPQCVFWDVNANDGVGDWSNEGCQFNRTLKDGNVVCQCNHLTSFAVLIDIYDQKALVLDFISKIGCGISITCLLITLVTYLSNRKLREKQSQQIMLHFCFSLLCLYLVFVIGIDRTTPRWGCTTVSVLIHYFALTSISWMGVEATNMYILFVKVVGVHIAKFMLKSALVAWGFPAVIVIIALSVDPTQYVNEQHCFLEIGNTFYFAQLLIMGLVISYNMVIFMLVMYRLLFRRAASIRSRDDMKAEIIKRVQNAVSITALLGLTWVFGLLSLIHEQSSFAFQVLFCLFNSMQGFLVFVMFCVRHKNVVQVWKGWFSFGKDSMRGNVTRSTSAASSTLDRPLKKQPRGNLAENGRNDIKMDQFQCTYIPPKITKSDDDVIVDNNER